MREGFNWVHSDTIGAMPQRTGTVQLNEEARHYPSVTKLLNRWLRGHLPPAMAKQFLWTSINVNKNYAARLHRDKNNVGPSMISAFGDFAGGALNYYREDDKRERLEVLQPLTGEKSKLDLGQGLLMFDGKRGHE